MTFKIRCLSLWVTSDPNKDMEFFVMLSVTSLFTLGSIVRIRIIRHYNMQIEFLNMRHFKLNICRAKGCGKINNFQGGAYRSMNI